jgi:hypothetical protein
MSTFLSKEEQGVVIFHIWKSLTYNARMGLSLFLIIIGFLIQYYSFSTIPGVFFILVGNLLLLVKGYDNRIKLPAYKAAAEWVKTDNEHLEQIVEINKKLKKWNISATDISNPRGILFFILVLVIVFFIYFIGESSYYPGIDIIAIDVLILLLPHWFTGIKRITTTPELISKIALYKDLMKNYTEKLTMDKVDYMILVKGEDEKLPEDVKMKITFENQPESLMGMYVQISMNNVEGRDYPYFYVVLVAKQEMHMLDKYYQSVNVPAKVIKEQSRADGTEIIIIRQYTTKSSGYHTDAKAIKSIFDTGIQTARMIIKAEV